MITIGNILGFSITSRIAGKINPSALIHGGCLFMIATCFYLVISEFFFHTQDYELLAFVVFFIAGSAFAIVSASSSGMNLNPKTAGVAAAFLGAIQIGSGAISSTIAGLLNDTVLMMSLGMTFFTFSGYLGFLWFSRKQKVFTT